MRKKKEESIENFLNKLIRAKGCFDVAEMESYIKRTTSYDRDLLDRQIERVEKLLDTRYGHYGKITEENEVEAWRQGFYVLEKLGVTLDDVRRMIGKFNIEEDSPMGIRIRQDWNYLGHLLNDYLYLENANLITYLKLLKDSQKRIGNQKMYSGKCLRIRLRRHFCVPRPTRAFPAQETGGHAGSERRWRYAARAQRTPPQMRAVLASPV